MKITTIKVAKFDKIRINIEHNGHRTTLLYGWEHSQGWRRNKMIQVTLPRRYHKDLEQFIASRKYQVRLRKAILNASQTANFMLKLEGQPLEKPKIQRRLEIACVFTGHSQYFGGHHLPHFPVQVDGRTSYATLKEQLLDWQTTDHISQLEGYEKAYNQAASHLFDGIPDMTQPAFPDLGVDPYNPDDPDDEDDWDCIAVFVVDGLPPRKE